MVRCGAKIHHQRVSSQDNSTAREDEAKAVRPSSFIFPPSSFLLTAGLVCLYAAARLWRLTAACLWFDEIFGVHTARHAWGDLWRFVAADLIHTPLF